MTSKHTRTGILLMLFIALMSHLAGSQTKNGAYTEKASPYFMVINEDSNKMDFPLESTDVNVNISGVIADVHVKQIYHNSGDTSIEAIYVFPASTRAAVYDMVMKVDEREIRAVVEDKSKARNMYRTAKKKGKTVSLLEEERPNVFKMKVGNIQAGATVEVNMHYTELLVPTDKVYEFVYPTVVGPRYISKYELATQGIDSWVVNPYLQAAAGFTPKLNLNLQLSTGMPIKQIRCETHANKINYQNASSASLRIKDSEGTTNDFVMHYSLSGDAVESGVLLYEEPNGENYFLAMIQPPQNTVPAAIPPREYVFIVDVSGSMNGFPIEISKQMMKELFQQLKPTDVFNIVCFAGGSDVFSSESVNANEANIERAIHFIDRHNGGGGTELLSALNKALDMKRQDNYSTSFIILTDGFVTVEKATFDLMRNKLGEANFFSFGIGSHVNRHLIEGMAHVGYGEPFFVLSKKETATTRQRFIRYVSQPQLTNISYELEGLEFYDVLPQQVPDLLAERPVIISGKYRGDSKGTLRIKGQTGEKEIVQTLKIDPGKNTSEKALKYLWAREKIRLLADYNDISFNSELKEEIIALGKRYNLLTEYTSFIAIDPTIHKTLHSTRGNQPPPPPPAASNVLNVVENDIELTEELMIEDCEAEFSELSEEEEEESLLIFIVEEMPEFSGGIKALKQFVVSNVVYPPKAAENGISGTVYISFAVDVDGSITDIKVARSVSPELDAEAIRLIKSMPKWKPGKQRGKAVKVSYTIPVHFTLN
jgi:Ca-activated chloride channel family protein